VREKYFGKKEIARLEPNHISFRTIRGDVTDEMLTSNEVGGGKGVWTAYPQRTIRAIRSKRVGYITGSSLWQRFEVESHHGKREFRVPDRDVANVMHALQKLAGDRFHEQSRRRLSAGEFAMTGFGIVAVVLLALGWAYSQASLAAGGIVLLFFTALAPLFCVLSKRRSEYKSDNAAPKKKRRPRSARRPFRSRVLGWGLKVIGLLYILFILFSDMPARLAGDKPTNWSSAWILLIPGLGALVIGSRLCQRTFDARRHPDPRPPILFLRAFDDDGKRTFQPTTQLASFHGIFRYGEVASKGWLYWVVHPTKLAKMFLNAETHSAEQLLAASFRRCGPLVAIGRPGEKLATSGADRMYVPDAEWQETVLDYLAKSQAVVLQPAQTDGVRWEIEQVFAHVPRNRILLSMLNFKDRPNRYEDFRSWLAREHGMTLPLAIPFQATPSCIYFENDGTVRCQPICYRSPLLWTFVGNAVDARRTFDTFIRGLHGGPRDLPEKPKRHAGHAFLSVPLAAAALLAFFFFIASMQAMVRYEAKVATDIVQNEIGRVAPAFGAAVEKQTTYNGRAIPYEFRLGPLWARDKDAPPAANVEYAFAFSDGIGKLIVAAKAGGPLTDLFGDALPESLRGAIETEVRKKVPGATIKVLGSRWVALNGIQWREIAFEQRYSTAVSEMKRVLYYSSPSGWMAVTIILPNFSHYQTVADELAATFKAPESDLDQLLRESRVGEPTTYQSKRGGYRISLRSIWVPEDMAQRVAGMGDAGKVLKEEVGIEGVEYSFRLGNGKFGGMECEVGDEPVDFGNLKEYGKEIAQLMQTTLEKVAPGFRIRIEVADPETHSRGGRRWGELRYRVVMSKESYKAEFRSIQRVTNHSGKSVSFSGRVQRFHPGVEAIIREALDSIGFDG
jgi:hypothetical protein